MSDDQKTITFLRNIAGTHLTVLMAPYNPSKSEWADIVSVDYVCIEAV